jgi:hypothetical protein
MFTTQARVKRMVQTAILDHGKSLRAAFFAVSEELGLMPSTVATYYYSNAHGRVAYKRSRRVLPVVSTIEKTAMRLLLSDRKEAERIFTKAYLSSVSDKALELL